MMVERLKSKPVTNALPEFDDEQMGFRPVAELHSVIVPSEPMAIVRRCAPLDVRHVFSHHRAIPVPRWPTRLADRAMARTIND
jgi:hypothetical protein